MRMLLAIVCSVVFTFVYAALAAKSRRAEMVLIPLLDILQSVPILGFLTFTVVFFLNLFPGRVFGAELASVFAIFTSQAWNMTFSMYQSMRSVPKDLDEASQSFHLNGWQRFWRLDVPFAMPGLIWNAMMSMSGGWFFVVASESITVGNTTVTLPGIVSVRFRHPMLPSPYGSRLGPRIYAFRGHIYVHCRYGPATRSLPQGDLVDRLQDFDLSPPCYPVLKNRQPREQRK